MHSYLDLGRFADGSVINEVHDNISASARLLHRAGDSKNLYSFLRVLTVRLE